MSRNLMIRAGLVILALIAAGAVAAWGASLGANAWIFLPVAAWLLALASLVFLRDPVVHRIATLAAVLVALVVAVIASASVGWYLLPAVVLGLVSAFLPVRDGHVGQASAR